MQQNVTRPRQARAPGFTIVELMVVVAVTAILASLAAPSFTDMFRRYRVDAAREEFTASVTLARVEAVRLGRPVVMRRLTGCGTALTGTSDWSCGWRLFADLNANDTLDGAEVVLQEVFVAPNITVVKGNATNPEFLVINRFGQATPVGQSFQVFPAGMAAVNGQLVCFSTGTRLQTVRNASACP